jgi:hypothetical protein
MGARAQGPWGIAGLAKPGLGTRANVWPSCINNMFLEHKRSKINNKFWIL